MDAEARPTLGVDPDGCLLMPGPLYHNGPVVWSCVALLAGAHLVVLPRFDAEATLAAIEEHSVDVVYLVPTMMKRIWRLPIEVRERYDLSSLRFVWHLAEPCPPWLKEAWIDWLGPERIWELYAGTEGQTATIITGDEWLQHRGSVGKPAEGSVLIADDDGNELPAGEQGEVWLRSTTRDTPSYRYVGAEARTRDGGWESLGDVGWLDDDGFLYLGDRLTDMILSGGANIYPAEVEAALQEHPDVRSCAVVGLPDDDLGQRVHAIVEADASLDVDGVLQFLRERLAPTSSRAPSRSSTNPCATTPARSAEAPSAPNASSAWRALRVADGAEAAPGEVGHEAGDLLGGLLRALVHPEPARSLGEADEPVGELAPLLHVSSSTSMSAAIASAMAPSTMATWAANSSSRRVPPPKSTRKAASFASTNRK